MLSAATMTVPALPSCRPIPQVYQDFFTKQEAWGRQQVQVNSSDPRWAAIGLLYGQFDGLQAGYAAVAPVSAALDAWAFQQLNGLGDFLDLIPALQGDSEFARPWRWENQTADETLAHVRKTTHCSGLFRVTGNYSDIFFGHSAWFTYENTNRIFKHYSFAPQSAGLLGAEMSFSSYPGLLESMDDYYTVHSTGLAVVETTNSIFNMTLYTLLKPESLFAWQRVRLANLLAADGMAWGALLAFENSGTYNNAYGVLKVSGWSPGQPLLAGMLVLAEQIPGLVVYGDVTQELERGYLPMYNVPYWPEIYALSGYPGVVAKHVRADVPLATQAISGLDYQLAARAQIFRRDAGKVETFDDFVAIMRYNDYLNDPYAQGSSWNAICSRGDLSADPSADGCYDTKASSASLMAARQSYIINGPTLGNGLPPFAWTQFPADSHVGLPAVYNFTVAAEVPMW